LTLQLTLQPTRVTLIDERSLGTPWAADLAILGKIPSIRDWPGHLRRLDALDPGFRD